MEKKTGRVKTDNSKLKQEKKTMPVYVKFGIAALVVLAAIVGGLLIWLNAASGYVATIGNEKIGVKEYNFYLTIQKQNMYYQAYALDSTLTEETFWKTEIEGTTAIEYAKKSTLEGIRDVKVQLAKAKENKISLTSDEMKSIDSYVKTNFIDPEEYGGGNRIRANKFFTDTYGFGVDEFKNYQVNTSIIQKYQKKVMDEMNITEDELKAEYDKDPKKFDEVTVTHVLFLYEGKDGNRTKEESKKLADDTLAKVKAGEDIKELAKTLSEDTGITQNAGVYTFAKEGQYVPQFEDWAFDANVGDSGIVETDYGYHVMKLDKKESKQFDDVKDKIKTELSANKYTSELDKWRKDTQYIITTNDAVYGTIS